MSSAWIGHSAKARINNMTRFAIGMNIKRLSAPLYPAFENILYQMTMAKMIEAIAIIPINSPKPVNAAASCDEVVSFMRSAPY